MSKRAVITSVSAAIALLVAIVIAALAMGGSSPPVEGASGGDPEPAVVVAQAEESEPTARSVSEEPAEAPAPAVNEAEDDSSTEGIQVHGHWTIEIYNPDGTLDQRVEFDNALTGEGAELLIDVLVGNAFVAGDEFETGPWLAIVIDDFCNSASRILFADQCFDLVNASFDGQTPIVPESGENAGDLVIESTFTFNSGGTKSGNIIGAATLLKHADSDSSAPEPGDFPAIFTSADLTPIPVEPDQTIDITVVISFS